MQVVSCCKDAIMQVVSCKDAIMQVVSCCKDAIIQVVSCLLQGCMNAGGFLL